MREQIVKEIDGFKYQFNPMAPSKAIALLTSIMKVAGVSGSSSTDKAAEALFANLADDAVLRIVQNALVGVIFLKPEGETGVQVIKPAVAECFDAHFQQFPFTHLFKVVWASLETNFSDFFSEMAKGGKGGFLEQIKNHLGK